MNNPPQISLLPDNEKIPSTIERLQDLRHRYARLGTIHELSLDENSLHLVSEAYRALNILDILAKKSTLTKSELNDFYSKYSTVCADIELVERRFGVSGREIGTSDSSPSKKVNTEERKDFFPQKDFSLIRREVELITDAGLNKKTRELLKKIKRRLTEVEWRTSNVNSESSDLKYLQDQYNVITKELVILRQLIGKYSVGKVEESVLNGGEELLTEIIDESVRLKKMDVNGVHTDELEKISEEIITATELNSQPVQSFSSQSTYTELIGDISLNVDYLATVISVGTFEGNSINDSVVEKILDKPISEEGGHIASLSGSPEEINENKSLGKEFFDKLVLDLTKKIDKKHISSQENSSGDPLEFTSAVSRKPSFDELIFDILKKHEEVLVKKIKSEEDMSLLIRVISTYGQIDKYTKVTGVTMQRYLHPDSLNYNEAEKPDRGEVNAKFFEEFFKTLVKYESSDIKDLDFALDILGKEGNKMNKEIYLRNNSLKKATDIMHLYYNQESSHMLGDEEKLVGSLSSLYHDFNESVKKVSTRSIDVPKRDFLLTIPLMMKRGFFNKDYFDTYIKFYTDSRFRRGDSRELTFFASLVDMYDPFLVGADDSILTLLLMQEYTKSEKQISDLVSGNEIKSEIFSQNSILPLSDLKRAYGDMRVKVVEDGLTEIDREIFFEMSDMDQKEYVDLSYDEHIQKISLASKKDYWKKALENLILSNSIYFEEILRKASALKLIDISVYNALLSDPVSLTSVSRFNRQLDKAQINTFVKHFDISDDIANDALVSINQTPPVGRINDFGNQLEQVYRQFGSFNAFFILLDRYSRLDIKGQTDMPENFKKNIKVLLKEFAFHVVKGDFKEWRSGIALSLQGSQLDYKKNDIEFWNIWNEDYVTSPDGSSFGADTRSVLLSQCASSEDKFNKQIENLKKQISSPFFWKDKRVVSMLKDFSDAEFGAKSVQKVLEKINSEDSDFLNKHGVQVKDKALVKKLKNNVLICERVLELVELLSEKKSLSNINALDGLVEVIQSMHVDTAMVSPGDDLIASKKKSGEVKLETNAKEAVTFIKSIQNSANKIQRIKRDLEKGMFTIVDSSDPVDLLRVGRSTHTIVNCTNFEGNPEKNAFILDIATSKNKKVLLVKKGKSIVCRAILKMLTTIKDEESSDNTPEKTLIIIDDVLAEDSNYDYFPEIIKHLKDKFSGRGDVYIGQGVNDTEKEYNLFIKNQTEGADVGISGAGSEMYTKIKDGSIVLGYGTGSRVSGELVETQPPGTMKSMIHATAKYEYKRGPNKGPKRDRNAFYNHLVEIL